MANANLLATIEPLRNCNFRRWKDDPYQNRNGIWGRHISFWYYSWHFISIHNCAAPQSPESVANALEGIEVISEEKWGAYTNRKRALGFYASARSTRAVSGTFDHWYMIGRSAEREVRSLLLRKRLLAPEEADLLRYRASKDRPRAD